MLKCVVWLMTSLLVLAGTAGAEDVYYRVPLHKLNIVEGQLRDWSGWGWFGHSRVTLMNEGEAYVQFRDRLMRGMRLHLSYGHPRGKKWPGTFICPRGSGTGRW